LNNVKGGAAPSAEGTRRDRPAQYSEAGPVGAPWPRHLVLGRQRQEQRGRVVVGRSFRHSTLIKPSVCSGSRSNRLSTSRVPYMRERCQLRSRLHWSSLDLSTAVVEPTSWRPPGGRRRDGPRSEHRCGCICEPESRRRHHPIQSVLCDFTPSANCHSL